MPELKSRLPTLGSLPPASISGSMFPMEHFSVCYDREADALYISFRRPQKATDTRVTAEGLLLRYHGEKLVGITILEASSRAEGLPALQGESQASAVQTRKRPAKKASSQKPEGVEA